jgi:hypothetical protein
MGSVAAATTIWRPRRMTRIDANAVAIWALAGGPVLYLAVDGGGYDLVVRSQVGVVVWWFVLVGAAAGLLPVGRVSRAAWVALALFGGFVAWTALAMTWSLSSERSVAEISRVASYLGVLLLGVAIYRERGSAMRHAIAAIATVVVAVSALALLSRLRPALFPSAQTTASLLPGANGRLSWPLNYWNALAALVAFGLPLLVAIATSARSLIAQAFAAGAVPLVVLCGYLTFSRGGAIAATVALIVFISLAPERIPKLATVLVSAAGSAALIAGAVHRHAIEQGLVGAGARHEGATLLIAVVLVCAGVGLAQTGIGLAVRHATLPRWLQVSRRRAWKLLAVAVVIGVIAGVLGGAPARLSHAWQDFKRPTASALHQNTVARFGSTSGNSRYTYWKVAIASTKGHLLQGSGPGTFELLWLPRAPVYNYVRNAHSLYIETLAEVGLVGLALLTAFLLLVIGASVWQATRGPFESRVGLAAVAAACVAFSVSAAFDWVWQVPVLPVAFLFLAASALAPSRADSDYGARRLGRVAARAGMVVAAVLSLTPIAIAMATTTAVAQSQVAAAAGNTGLALADARAASRIEPGAASPQIQSALVLELRGDLNQAIAAATRATDDESTNWQPWLILSRLQAEAGHPGAAVIAYRRARSLNPRSPVFHRG